MDFRSYEIVESGYKFCSDVYIALFLKVNSVSKETDIEIMMILIHVQLDEYF